MDKDGPWVASIVCRLWRAIVLSCPLAWSSVQLDLEDKVRRAPLIDDPEWCIEEDSEQENSNSNRRPLDLWLERSGNCSISLSLILGRICPTALTIYDVILKFAAVMDRVETIELGVESRMVADSLLYMFWDKAPRLRYLTVKCGRQFQETSRFWEFEDVVIKSLPVAITKAPALRGLTLHDCTFPDGDNIAYRGVRELSLVDVKCPSILASFDGLEVLNIESCSFNRARVVLPNLKSLKVRDYAEAPEDVLLTIRAPALELLEVKVDNPYRCLTIKSETRNSEKAEIEIDKVTRDFKEKMDTQGSSLVKFARHSPMIKTMKLVNVYVKDAALITCFRRLSHLRSLTLIGSWIGGEAFKALSEQLADEEVAICQQLKTFMLESCPLVRGTMLKKFIDARDDGCRLSRLGVVRCEKILEEDIIAAWLCDLSASLQIDYVPWEEAVIVPTDEDEEEYQMSGPSIVEETECVDPDPFERRKDTSTLAGRSPSTRKKVTIEHIFRDQDLGPALKRQGPRAVVVHDMFFPNICR
ncbi:hypothetical protein NEOLEDRAFT_1240222 [Neolentinus lepideus HHB14362 ss-1]|uniref:F-box domain-containing protein n=1 Tax=Neolentinus lepideus HHB14362 ss-1 TaxID=1314782 RepID=A0A165U5I7_9AGAM|nr:hypothetical protein NEOLEDRAFT_1240222 [Neolentinus lepideus HHB14362 ss-1]